jgi:hypothetical protein
VKGEGTWKSPKRVHKSELPLNVINYYKIKVISEIFLIILEFPK